MPSAARPISISATRCGRTPPATSPTRRRCRCSMGLRESLAVLQEEGLENVFARHHHLAGGARAAVQAWGLKLCAKEPKWHSDTVSAILVPQGFNGADVIDRAYRRYNLALGAGSDPSRRQAVPHRTSRRSERVDAARRDRGRRDGHARCRHRDRVRLGRCGGAGCISAARKRPRKPRSPPNRWEERGANGEGAGLASISRLRSCLMPSRRREKLRRVAWVRPSGVR